MSPLETTLADYRTSGITTGPHVMAHLRAELEQRGVVRLGELRTRADGCRLRTAGLVVVRQRPATARGFCFLTVEDETGLGNAVLAPDRFERFRALLHTSPLLILEGELERRDGVVHLRIEAMEALQVADAVPSARDFR